MIFIDHWKLTLSSVLAITLFWLGYRYYKMCTRRCSCGSLWVKRIHTMQRICKRIFWTSTATECEDCHKYEVVKKRQEKEFNSLALLWRLVFFKKQFADRRLPKRQAKYTETCRAEGVLFLMRRFETAKIHPRDHKPKLDAPMAPDLNHR